jgi:chromosome segregation ATPase
MKKMNIKLFKIAGMLVLVAIFTSCQKYKNEIEQLTVSKDSIQMVVDTRNDVILDYVGSMNEIQQNLDSIKGIQNLVNMNLSRSNSEKRKTEKEKILNDIALIHSLLNQNKKQVELLQNKLKTSNLKSDELKQMIQSYAQRIEAKDAEIRLLNKEMGMLKINISSLNQKIDSFAVKSIQKSTLIEQQESELNSVYYCFGSKDELIENNVIEKTGGFLGLGKTLKVKSDFNQEYFTKEDQRITSEIILMVKEARLLTFHPDSTYQFEQNEKIIQKMAITDPVEFWKVSKYLVILVE